MNKFFNACHSPVGSYSSFTLGFKGASGGFGNMLGKPADQDIYIGYGKKSEYKLFPFFDENAIVDIENFTEDPVFPKTDVKINIIEDGNIEREFNVGTDTFKSENLTFKIYTPHYSIPENDHEEQFKLAITPALIAEITYDNDSDEECDVVFGFKQNNKSSCLRHVEQNTGIIDGLETSIVTDDKDTRSVTHFTLKDALYNEFQNHEYNRQFLIVPTAILVTKVPPRTKKTVYYSLNFFVDGQITSGINTKFKYTDFFNSIEEVSNYALDHKEEIIEESLNLNKWLDKQDLSFNQKFQIAHSQKAYYAFTQLLKDNDGRMYHLVNEGEYQMIQTFDLMIDHLFFELEKNPWVVKNNLELFSSRYSYRDQVKDQDGVYPGGISFTHDMGNLNHFTPKGRSSYELADLDGCFSHMTYEQLTNFIITSLTYGIKTNDIDYLKKNKGIIDECLISMLNRDHYIPEERNGLMSLDSTRCGKGSEITTYDSLDKSLGQSRNNTYIASKIYASYCLLNEYYKLLADDSKSSVLEEQLLRLNKTIESSMSNGLIPAVIEEGNEAYIIPLIEGLVYLKYLGYEEYLLDSTKYGNYISCLKEHTQNIFEQKLCVFENGGYRLSSTSNMTWLSKIYIAQYLHKEMFDLKPEIQEKADEAHVDWLLDEELSYWAWSDQILNFKIKGSKYYPRGVTSFLWTK